MRIIGGKYKSRLIKMPLDIRPTSNKVRGAIFNVFAMRINGSRVLDLFAGSGAFGMEALSRGADSAVFVDNNKASIAAIEESLDALRVSGSISLMHKDAMVAIKLLHRESDKFDIIFLDPPYHRNWARKCLKYISLYDILSHSGLLIVEHFRKDVAPLESGNLKLSRQLHYGDTSISIYSKKAKDERQEFLDD